MSEPSYGAVPAAPDAPALSVGKPIDFSGFDKERVKWLSSFHLLKCCVVFSPVDFKGNRFHYGKYCPIFSRGLNQMEGRECGNEPRDGLSYVIIGVIFSFPAENQQVRAHSPGQEKLL